MSKVLKIDQHSRLGELYAEMQPEGAVPIVGDAL